MGPQTGSHIGVRTQPTADQPSQVVLQRFSHRATDIEAEERRTGYNILLFNVNSRSEKKSIFVADRQLHPEMRDFIEFQSLVQIDDFREESAGSGWIRPQL